MLRLVLALVALMAIGSDVCAQYGTVAVYDGLAQVNAARARRGLRPFTYDMRLAQAAQGAVAERASRGIQGHLRDDFVYSRQAGAGARAAGCGVHSSYNAWSTCCTYERWQYAGAAWATGPNGMKYMHIFVR